MSTKTKFVSYVTVSEHPADPTNRGTIAITRNFRVSATDQRVHTHYRSYRIDPAGNRAKWVKLAMSSSLITVKHYYRTRVPYETLPIKECKS